VGTTGLGAHPAAGDGLGIAQQVQDGAGLFDRVKQGLQLGVVGAGLHLHLVTDVVGPDGRGFVAGLAGARVDGAAHIHADAVQRHLQQRGLDFEDVGHAGAQHAQLQLGRGGAQVEAGEVVGAVTEDLVLADAQAAHATAAFGGDVGVQVVGLRRALGNALLACQDGGALVGEVVVQAHGGTPVRWEVGRGKTPWLARHAAPATKFCVFAYAFFVSRLRTLGLRFCAYRYLFLFLVAPQGGGLSWRHIPSSSRGTTWQIFRKNHAVHGITDCP